MVQPSERAEFALRLGDDALVLSQRLCEWNAAAPTLEEDIAMTNVGLDFLGRARMLLQYAGGLLEQSEDQLAFLRDAHAFRNLLIVELPIGDFAFTLTRQYLLDAFEGLYFARLTNSADETLAAIAGKTLKEVDYHQRRSAEWMRRLGLGTEESHRRTQAAVEEVWGYVGEFFLMDELESRLVEAGIAVDRRELESPWRETVGAMLTGIEIEPPSDDWQVSGGRNGVHTEHLGHMLSDMQFMQRTYAGLKW